MVTGHGAVLDGGSRYRLQRGPRAKHRASRTPFQVGVGHIRLFGEAQLASLRNVICL